MATVPSVNATATRYAANGKDIWVPKHQYVPGTSIDVGEKALPDALKFVYGKILTAKPTAGNEQTDALFYGVTDGRNQLQYYNGTRWVTIFDADLSGHFYETTVIPSPGPAPTESELVTAAQTELFDHRNDDGGSGVGDVVIVHWTENAVTKYESFICVAFTPSDPVAATDYTVAHTTSENAKEVRYTGAPGHIISAGTTVEECLQALDQAGTDYGRYILTNAIGNTPLEFAYDGLDKSFPNYTGVLKLTCCINCAEYISTGIITCVVVNGSIEADSMTLADYFVKSLAVNKPGSGDMDIFDLDFEIDSTSHKLVVKTSSTKTVVSGTVVTVKVQW